MADAEVKGCGCSKGGTRCHTNRCGCVKEGRICGEACKCTVRSCEQRAKQHKREKEDHARRRRLEEARQSEQEVQEAQRRNDQLKRRREEKEETGSDSTPPLKKVCEGDKAEEAESSEKGEANEEDGESSFVITLAFMTRSRQMCVQGSMTVLQLKQRIQNLDGHPPEYQKMLLVGKELKNEDTLAKCGVSQGAKVFVLVGFFRR